MEEIADFPMLSQGDIILASSSIVSRVKGDVNMRLLILLPGLEEMSKNHRISPMLRQRNRKT